MDAEVALVMVDKLSSWLSLSESQTYLDSHPNVARKLKQKFSTISPPPRSSGEDPTGLQQDPIPSTTPGLPPTTAAPKAASHRQSGQATPFSVSG